jgi:hypothetical protein
MAGLLERIYGVATVRSDTPEMQQGVKCRSVDKTTLCKNFQSYAMAAVNFVI